MFFMASIEPQLPPRHLASGYNSYELSSHGEGDEQRAPPVRLAEGEKAALPGPRVSGVMAENQWVVEENLLALEIRHFMLFPVLVAVSRIPIEPCTIRPDVHCI
jgi:hypothetical protein